MSLSIDSVSSFRDDFACQKYREHRIIRSDFLSAGKQVFSGRKEQDTLNYTFPMLWAKTPKVEPEEEKELRFKGKRAPVSAYGGIIGVVEKGDTVRVEVEKGGSASALRWRISNAFKKANMPVELRVLADGSAVVACPVARPDAPPPAKAPDPAARNGTPVQTAIPVPPQAAKRSSQRHLSPSVAGASEFLAPRLDYYD